MQGRIRQHEGCSCMHAAAEAAAADRLSLAGGVAHWPAALPAASLQARHRSAAGSAALMNFSRLQVAQLHVRQMYSTVTASTPWGREEEV